jgi:hypothetical protein
MMVADLTRFLRQSPELFRVISGGLRGQAVFRKPTNLGIFTAVLHKIPYLQRTGNAARHVFLTEHLRHPCVRK